jgi:hypothetical protein
MNRTITMLGALVLLMLECRLAEGAPVARLANISGRSQVQTGDNVMITGFIISGEASKKVMVRGLGPSLSGMGVEGTLADPVLELHEPGGTVLINDNWQSSQAAEIAGTGIPPSDSLESAIVATLAPGAYTAVLRGADDGVGVGLLEIYDLDEGDSSALANLSTRARVGIGDDLLIAGVIITGNGSAPVTVRALGPSLAEQGVIDPLPDPSLDLYDANGFLIAQNDDWKTSQETDLETAGIAPPDDSESATMVTLLPGSYTAVVRGNEDQTGVALVEVYQGPALSYDHILVIVMENVGYDNVIGSSSAPYINDTLLPQATLYTNSYAVAHPSLPNYLALFAGSTLGVTNDNCTTDNPPNGPFDAPNLYSELTAIGKTALAYMEDLPFDGYSDCEWDLYVQRHNPFMYFDAGTANRVPYSASVVYAGPYTATFSWPNVTFISPNLINDMHNGSNVATKVANGDTWLAQNLPPLISYARSNNGLIAVTMDEDDFGDQQHIPTILVGDRVAAGQINLQTITHYNVTKTITDNFGLAPIGETAGLATLVPVP